MKKYTRTYSKLVKERNGLLAREKIEDRNLIVAYRKYTFVKFEDPKAFLETLMRINEGERNFYEIILHERDRDECFVKFYADIDISREKYEQVGSNKTFEEFGEEVFCKFAEQIMMKLKISGNNIMKFNSHGKNKLSYHIIILEHAFRAKSLEKLFEYLTEGMDEKYVQFYDPSVYSKKQQFRLLWNQKWDDNQPSGRVKVHVPRFKIGQGYGDPIYGQQYYDADEQKYVDYQYNNFTQNLDCFEKSLVTYTVGCSRDLALRLEDMGIKAKPKPVIQNLKAEIKEVLAMLPEEEQGKYKAIGKQGSLVLLKRLKPSKCLVCKRIHHNENPFLSVVNNRVHFNCRRNKDKLTKYLGELKEKEKPDTNAIVQTFVGSNIKKIKFKESQKERDLINALIEKDEREITEKKEGKEEKEYDEEAEIERIRKWSNMTASLMDEYIKCEEDIAKDKFKKDLYETNKTNIPRKTKRPIKLDEDEQGICDLVTSLPLEIYKYEHGENGDIKRILVKTVSTQMEEVNQLSKHSLPLYFPERVRFLHDRIDKRVYLKRLYNQKLRTFNSHRAAHVEYVDPFKIYKSKEHLSDDMRIPETWHINFEDCDKYKRSQYPTNYSTIVDYSQMDHGKTYQLKKWLIKMRKKQEIRNIFFVSFRRKLTKNFQMRFRNFEDKGKDIKLVSYMDKTYAPCIIYQVESLHKLDSYVEQNMVSPDCIVIDEVTSVLDQFQSPYHGAKLITNRRIFKSFVSQAKYVWVGDADIDQRAIQMIRQFRPEKRTYFNYNRHVNTDRKAIILDSQADQIIKISEHIKQGKKLVIINPSEKGCHKIHELIHDLNPSLKIRTYTAKLADNPHELQDPNKYWSKLDVLIYNSTIGAGVSYDIKHFDIIHVMNSDRHTVSVRQLKQLLGRVRSINDNTVYFCKSSKADKSHMSNITTLYTCGFIKRELQCYSTIRDHWIKSNMKKLEFEYNITGKHIRKSLIEDYWNTLHIYNILERRNSRDFYPQLLEHMIISLGYHIVRLKPHDEKIRMITAFAYDGLSKVVDEKRKDLFNKIDTKELDIENCKHKKDTGNATTKEKAAVIKSSIEKRLIKPTSDDILHLEQPRNFKCLLNYLYETDNNHKPVELLLTEIQNENHSLLSFRMFSIRQINKVIGIKHSGDSSVTFQAFHFTQKMLKYLTPVRYAILSTVFKYPRWADDKNKITGLKDWTKIKRFLNHIYSSWSQSHIEMNKKRKYKVVKGIKYNNTHFTFEFLPKMSPIIKKLIPSDTNKAFVEFLSKSHPVKTTMSEEKVKSIQAARLLEEKEMAEWKSKMKSLYPNKYKTSIRSR